MELDPQGAETAQTESNADPKAVAPANGANTGAGTGSNTPSPGASASTETEDKRARRAAEEERDTIRAELDRLKGESDSIRAYRDLEKLAKDDVTQWVAEMAQAASVTPQRIIEILTKKGTGEKVSVTLEEKMAALEKRLADRDAKDAEREKAQETERAAANRRANVASTATFLKNSAKDFPACAADESAAQDVYDVVEARYAQLPEFKRPKDQEGLKALYTEAAQKVEAALAARAEKWAAAKGWQKPGNATQPKTEGVRGLLLSDTGSAAPTSGARDAVRTADEIEAWINSQGN